MRVINNTYMLNEIGEIKQRRCVVAHKSAKLSFYFGYCVVVVKGRTARVNIKHGRDPVSSAWRLREDR